MKGSDYNRRRESGEVETCFGHTLLLSETGLGNGLGAG